MNSDALFGMALGLQAPWEITEVTFKTNDVARRELHLRIGFVTGSKFQDEAGVDALYTTQLSVSGSTSTSLNTIVSYIAKYRASPPVKARCEQSMCRGHGHKVASRFYSRHLPWR